MSNDNREPTLVEQFGLRRLYPQNRLFRGQGQSAVRAVQPSTRRTVFSTERVEAPPGCCMFATGIITEASENRSCELAADCFCPATNFKDPKVFRNCAYRVEAEKEYR